MALEEMEESAGNQLPTAYKSILASDMGLQDSWMCEDTEVNQGEAAQDPLILSPQKMHVHTGIAMPLPILLLRVHRASEACLTPG